MASESTTEQQRSSRIPNFFRLAVTERIKTLHERQLLSSTDVQALLTADHQLQLNVADKMIENVVGVFGLPMGVALNFMIDK